MNKWLVAAVICCLSACFSASAQKSRNQQPVSEAAAELTLDQNLKVPVVPEKLKKNLTAYMRKEAENLHKLGYRGETMRQGEIVIVTVPTDPLFPPNDSVLNVVEANRLLKPLASYMRTPERYKILMAVHTDDTGSENYTFNLSEARILSIYEYFDKIAQHTDCLTGYPMGNSRPETNNSSRALRAQNRRVEFYIVPDRELIQTLQKRSR